MVKHHAILILLGRVIPLPTWDTTFVDNHKILTKLILSRFCSQVSWWGFIIFQNTAIQLIHPMEEENPRFPPCRADAPYTRNPRDGCQDKCLLRDSSSAGNLSHVHNLRFHLLSLWALLISLLREQSMLPRGSPPIMPDLNDALSIICVELVLTLVIDSNWLHWA